MGWTATFNATGPRGPGIVSGSGAPTSSAGAVNDFYLDTSTSGGPYLYGPKTSSGWPSASISLLGATGAAGPQFLFGTTQPGSPSFGGLNVGDFYLRTDTSILYQLQRVSGSATMVQIGSFLGGTGPQGLSVLSGSGAPSSSLGVVNQPAYYDTTNGFLYGAKTSSGWPSSYVNLNGAVGQQGASIRTGGGAPTSSIGNVGDVYIDTASYNAPVFYAAKTSSGWPSTGTSLIGSAGLSVLTGSGAPASSLGAQGQTYIDTTALALYVKGSSAWGSAQSLVGSKGAQGDAGLSLLSGAGAPASSLGATGQPAYIDTTAGALYSAKTSSGWPSTPLSLVGQQGPLAPSITNGTGAPNSSNPGGTITAGSFYIRTDTTPNQLFGPYTAANGWPSSYTNMGGGNFQVSSGPPAISLGSVGDIAIDTTNALFYPPKTSSGWTASPINIVGPAGPSMQVQPTFGTYASANGPACSLNNVTTSSTAVAAQVPGMSQTCTYVPATASAFMGGTFVNYTATGASLTFTLYDVTAGANTSYSVSVGKATVQTVGPFAATAYPLTAGHQYVWNVTGSSAAYCTIQPNYLYPSTWSGSIGAAPTQVFPSAAVSSTAAILQPPGLSGQYAYYANPNPSFLYGYNIVVTGSSTSTCQLQLYNSTSGSVVYTTPTVAASASGTNLTQGPFGVSAAYIPANAQMYWRIIGSGTVAASVTYSVCQ